MNADDIVKALPQVAAAVSALAGLIGSIVAAFKASRAERAARSAASIAYEIKATMQAQAQRQVQQLNITLATTGEAKGGELIDLSGGPPAGS